MNKTTRRLFAILVMAVLMGCHYEDFETDTAHQHLKRKTTEVSFDEFRQATQLYTFDTKYKIPPGKSPYMQRDANGNYELSDFIVDTDKITRTIVGNDTTYAFILIPKEYVNDKEYYLTLYKELANWENSVIEKRKETQEEIYKEVYTTMARGTGCITIFSEANHCTKRSKLCIPTCDRCAEECSTYSSYRLCGGNDGEEYNDPSFSEDPNNGGGGSGPPPDAPDPEDEEPVITLPLLIKPGPPCKELKDKTNDSIFSPRLKALKTQANFDKNNETGFIETRDVNNEVEYVNILAQPKTHKLIFPKGIKFPGFAHVHNDKLVINGNKRISIRMFSPGDLQAFTINCQQNAVDLGLTYKDTYGIVVTSLGTFALKMLTPTVDVSNIDWHAFNDEYEDKFNELMYSGNDDADGLKIMFLKLLKQKKIDANIGLFEATNSDLTEWKRVTLNGNYLSYSQCN